MFNGFQRHCQIKGHDLYKVDFLCTFKECNVDRWLCSECFSEERHSHGQSSRYNKWLLKYHQFAHIISEEIKNNEQISDKIEEMRKNFEKQCKNFKDSLELWQFYLQKDIHQLQHALNVGLGNLTQEQIHNIINPYQKIQKWDHLVKQSIQIIIKLIYEIKNIVELFKQESLQTKKSQQSQQEKVKIINSLQEEDFMYQHKKNKQIQIESCVNHQILVIKQINDYITNKKQELNSWEYLISQIAASFFALEQQIKPVKDQNSLINKILEDHKKQTQRFDQIIIGQEKIDLKQQKQFNQEKQIQNLINQLNQIIIDLKRKQPGEYFQQIQDIDQQKKINRQSDNKVYSEDDKLELFEADQINWKELFEEFQISQISEQYLNQMDSEGDLIQEGLIQLKLGFYEISSSIFEKAIQQNPKSSRAYHCKANIQALLNQHKQADDLYSIAIKLDPDYETCYLNKLRNLYMDWKQYGTEGDKLLKEIKIKFPNCKKIQYIERYQKIRRGSKILNGQSNSKF